MGDLRFRITSTSDPSCFDGGSDFLNPFEPRPWSVPLLRMANTQQYKSICEHLVAEGLVSRELLQRCRLIWNNTFRGPFEGGSAPYPFIHHLNQPFFLKFKYPRFSFSFWVVKEEKMLRCVLQRPLTCRRMTGKYASPVSQFYYQCSFM